MYAPNVREITLAERESLRIQSERVENWRAGTISAEFSPVDENDSMIVNASVDSPARGMMAA